jgi:hypothetical protein
MNLRTLLSLVNHPDTKIRLNAVYAIGMADETRALETLQRRRSIETDPQVQKAILRVSGHLNQLRQQGYDPIRTICAHFNVYSDVLALADAREVSIAKRLSQAPQEMDIQESDEMRGSVFSSVDLNTTGNFIAANEDEGMSGLTAVADSLAKDAELIPAIYPCKGEDVAVWLRRFKTEENADVRVQILAHIANINNPDAVLIMAGLQVSDPDANVRAAAKRFGRILYWQYLYFEMTTDGTIEKIQKELAEQINVNLASRKRSRPAVIMQESISQILKRAEARRQAKYRA